MGNRVSFYVEKGWLVVDGTKVSRIAANEKMEVPPTMIGDGLLSFTISEAGLIFRYKVIRFNADERPRVVARRTIRVKRRGPKVRGASLTREYRGGTHSTPSIYNSWNW